MEHVFRVVFEDIRSGGFAERFQRELAAGYPTVRAIREWIDGDNPISAAEKHVRAALDGQCGGPGDAVQ